MIKLKDELKQFRRNLERMQMSRGEHVELAARLAALESSISSVGRWLTGRIPEELRLHVMALNYTVARLRVFADARYRRAYPDVASPYRVQPISEAAHARR